MHSVLNDKKIFTNLFYSFMVLFYINITINDSKMILIIFKIFLNIILKLTY